MTSEYSDEAMEGAAARAALGRVSQPEEQAAAAIWHCLTRPASLPVKIPTSTVGLRSADPGMLTHRTIGYFALVGAIVGYGGLWPVTRKAIETIPPFWFASLRMWAGVLILLAVLPTPVGSGSQAATTFR